MLGAGLTVVLVALAAAQPILIAVEASESTASCRLDRSLKAALAKLDGVAVIAGEADLRVSASERTAGEWSLSIRQAGHPVIVRRLRGSCDDVAAASLVVLERALRTVAIRIPERESAAESNLNQQKLNLRDAEKTRSTLTTDSAPKGVAREVSPYGAVAANTPLTSGADSKTTAREGATLNSGSKSDEGLDEATKLTKPSNEAGPRSSTPSERAEEGSPTSTAPNDVQIGKLADAVTASRDPGATPDIPPPRLAKTRATRLPSVRERSEPERRAGRDEPGAPLVEAAPVMVATAAVSSPGSAPTTAPADPLVTRFEVTASAALLVPTSGQTRGALAIEPALFFHAWRASLLGVLPMSESSVISDGAVRGSVTTQALTVAATGARCIGSALRGCLGVMAGARMSFGSATGTYIFHSGSAVIARPSLGVIAQAAWSPFAHGVLAFDVIAAFNPLGATFVVDGFSPISAMPLFELNLRISVGFSTAVTWVKSN